MVNIPFPKKRFDATLTQYLFLYSGHEDVCKTKLATTKSKLTELGAKASNIFQVDYAPLKRKSRWKKKQNKHRAAKRKAVRTSQRTSAVLQKIIELN